jgi:hypothetical protein
VQERARIGGFVLRRFAQHAFVAGQFLVEPEARQRQPGQRVEPQQCAGEFGQQAPQRIAATQMIQLVA